VTEEIISRRGPIVVRRLILEPGEATRWHVDPFHRVTTVVRGEALAIEYRDSARTVRIPVCAGMSDWDAPAGQVHRAVNAGSGTYEEVAVFFMDRPEAEPQPTPV
jgi:quercetin dioxygenase-like cupin family protein